jgi:hypothetical protein
LESKIRQLGNAAKVEAALRANGVDYDRLRPIEKTTLESSDFEGEEPSEEWVAKVVSEGGLPVKRSDG